MNVAVETLETKQEATKPDIFFHIIKIDEIAKQAGGLNDLFYEFSESHLQFLSAHLQTSKLGTALLAVLVNLYNGDRISITRLAKYLDCKLIEVLTYMDEFEVLEQKGLLHIIRDSEDFRGFDHNELSFELRYNTIDELRKGNFTDPDSAKNLSIEKFFIHLERLCEEIVQRRQSYDNAIKVMLNLLRNNEHLLFVQKIKKLELPEDALIVFIRFFHYLINVDQPEMNFFQLSALYDQDYMFSMLKKSLKSGDHILIKKGLVENSCSDGFSDTEAYRLTDSAKEDFLVELEGSMWKIPVKGLKSPDSIIAKKLYYPEKTQQGINELSLLLEQEKFKDIQKRLSENGMRQGFTCLFMGGPGTGKTETVYQIAKASGRDIMQVDIANTKSKWFGDSEKIIKGVFEKYRYAVKRNEITPILFFNEADAVFGKRRLLNENHNGPGQTENAIQNIILSEIENLTGILIATTNLESNFDPAFERRFLYKIEFSKPDAETRKSIWGSMISGLSNEDALYLASHFDFSGGQIENISRKATVHQVLSGKVPLLKDIVKYCNEELYTKTAVKIGFSANS
ncbi:MAG: ATP-binding protein [Treponema sp.]|nr:ATP-binding protein [Treponema sp.]